MDSTTAYFESWLNAPHYLLGRKLEPLCLRHLTFLYAMNSSLVITNLPIALVDLELAALVCSSKATDSETFFPSKEITPIGRFFRKLWHRRNKRRDLQKEVKAFLGYYEDYLALPDMADSEKGKGNCPFNFLLMHAAALIKRTGWTESEVFNLPIGKVVNLNLALGYCDTGETTVISDTEAAAIVALRKQKGDA